MGNKENHCEKGCDKYKQTMDEVVDALAIPQKSGKLPPDVILL